MVAKIKLIAVGIACLILSACFIVLHFENYGKSSGVVGVVRVACVGDSITEGSGYPANLQAMLGDNYTVNNFGVCGSAVCLKSDLPYMSQGAFQRAKMSNPDVVVIMLGTNDACANASEYIEDFEANYKKLINAFQNLGSSPDVWLVNPPPIFENDMSLTNANLVENVIPQIEKVAEELQLPTIDVYRSIADCSDYFGDGVHPNSEGAQVIANEIYQAIVSDSVSP